MPNRTDAPPRTQQPTPAVSGESPLVASPPADAAAGEAREDLSLTHESFRAILSSQQRAGRWEASDDIEVRSIAGDVTLDFTRADLPPSGVIEIDAWTLCGHIRIIVPDGAEVEIEGTPVLGSIEQHARKKGAREAIREWVTGERAENHSAPRAGEPPFFRIEARAILGAIEVTGR